jgi:hypothetical protein
MHRNGIVNCIILLVSAALILSGCEQLTGGDGNEDGDGEDTSAPVPGDNGSIGTASVTKQSVELSWSSANGESGLGLRRHAICGLCRLLGLRDKRYGNGETISER